MNSIFGILISPREKFLRFPDHGGRGNFYGCRMEGGDVVDDYDEDTYRNPPPPGAVAAHAMAWGGGEYAQFGMPFANNTIGALVVDNMEDTSLTEKFSRFSDAMSAGQEKPVNDAMTKMGVPADHIEICFLTFDTSQPAYSLSTILLTSANTCRRNYLGRLTRIFSHL